MAITKVVIEKNTHSFRGVSVGKSGDFIFSISMCKEIKNIPNISVDFYQDDKDKTLWYINFSSYGDIPMKKKDASTFVFFSLESRKKIFESMGKNHHDFGRVKMMIGKMIVKDQVDLYPLITSSIK
jgi:hypothetical protein